MLPDGEEGLAAVVEAPGGRGSVVAKRMQLLTTARSKGPAGAPGRLGNGVALLWT
jgi:hypothetical protein